MFKKLLLSFLMVVISTAMSGCAVVGAGIGGAISVNEAEKLKGLVEVGEVKAKLGVNVDLLRTAKLSSVIFEKDMTTLNTSPDQNNIKVSVALTDEIKRSLGFTRNISSAGEIGLKSVYHNSYPGASWYYLGVTEKNTLGYFGSEGVRKLVNAHLILDNGGDVLLEVHGLWVSGYNGDEIAGARQLAREMVSEVLKKLSATASTPPTVTEAKKE